MEKMDKVVGNRTPEEIIKKMNTIELCESSQRESRFDYKSECEYGICDGYGVVYELNADGFMVGDNCKCVKEKIQAKRIAFAQIPDEFVNQTVNSFQIDYYKKPESQGLATVAKKIAVNYVKAYEEMKAEGQGLYLYSDTKGSGKSRLAVSVANELIKGRAKDVRYVTTLDLFAEIRSTFDNNDTDKTESKIMEEIKNVELLVLDDIGVDGKVSGWANGILYQIIDYRMVKKKVTIFTSNVPVTSLNYDTRTVGRIENMAMQIKMPEESVRSSMAKNKNVEMMKRLMRD